MTDSYVSSAEFDLAVCAVILAIGLAWLGYLVRGYLRARRNHRQVAADMALRRGFKAAARLGWVKR